jgi:O-antigen/teichoic acid export membrane protein
LPFPGKGKVTMSTAVSENTNIKKKDNDHESVKRVAKNTGFLYARMAITLFISLYVTRLVLGSLGTDDFGIYSLVGGMVAMLMFLNGAMAAASQRFMSYAQGEGNIDKQKNIFNVSTFIHFFIAIVLVIFLEAMGYLLFDRVLNIPLERLEAARYVFHFMVVSTFFTVISVPYDAVINARENMFFVAVTGILESLLKLAIAIYITYTDFDKLISFGMLMAMSTILLLIIKRIYCHKYYAEVDINIKKYFDKALFKEMGSFASWSFLGSASSMISNYSQPLIVNYFFGTTVNAAQGVAGQLNGQLSVVSSNLMKALNPMIVRNEGGGNREFVLKAGMFGAKLSFFLLMTVSSAFMLETEYVLNIWLINPPEFAVVFCKLLIIRTLIEQLIIPIVTILSAEGRIKRYQVVSSITRFFPLIFSFSLFHFGYEPYIIYWVYIIYAIIDLLIIVFFAKQNCNFNVRVFFTDVVIRTIVVFSFVLLFSSLPFYFLASGWGRLLLVFSVSIFSSILFIYLIGLTSPEKKNLHSFISHFLHRYYKRVL